MQLGIAGENLIKSYESLPVNSQGNPIGYLDPVGIPTIGWGHTGSVDGVAVYEGMVITKAKAQELFNADVASFVNTINSTVTVTLTQAQFDALVSLVYNIGGTNWRSSTLLRLLNQGNYAGASEQFGVWIKAKGKVLQGLVDRRKAERNLFDSQTYPEGTPDPEDPEVIIPPPPNPEPNPEVPPPYSPPDGQVYMDIENSSYNLNELTQQDIDFLSRLQYGDAVRMKFTFKRNKKEIGTTYTGKRLTFDNKQYIIKSVSKKGFIDLQYGLSICYKNINPKLIKF